MRRHLAVATLVLSAALSLAAAPAFARQVDVPPTDEYDLSVACILSGGDTWGVGSIYGCIVENCDGKGGKCEIICDNEGEIITCEGHVPRRVATSMVSKALLDLLGLDRTPTFPTGSLSGAGASDSLGVPGGGGGTTGGGGMGPVSSTGNAGVDGGAGGVIY